tara:strand:+ start:386 stop:715 length:330 start_codon:yes stop_codon:yes gene_type:complete
MEKNKIKEIEKIILKELDETLISINEYKELTKPIKPENSIGRVSRMDAINNKSVMEESLRKLEAKYEKLKFIKTQTQNEDFGICLKCKNQIPLGRIMIIPESRFCVKCV